MTGVVDRIDWDLAACFEHDQPDLWHPSESGSNVGTSLAKKICVRCPIRPQCAAYAIARPVLQGIWGGLTASDRQAWRARDEGTAA